MRLSHYVDLVRRAVESGDAATITALAAQLSDCEDAKRILRMKGYGTVGSSAGGAARLVPEAKVLR